MNTVERCRGRWCEILTRVGIDPRFLLNKHGPCPICGGKDRFRFDDRDGSGSYICNHCGAGAGLHLVRKFRNCDHATACREVDKIIGVISHSSPSSRPRDRLGGNNDQSSHITASSRNSKKKLSKARAIRQLLTEANDPAVAHAYLRRRGLTTSSSVILGHRRCPYFDDDHRPIGRYPALVAPITGPDGRLQSALRIYDADVDAPKKILPPINTIKGGAIRLYPADDELGISEGLENALAAFELFRVPTWAALSANGIECFQPPPRLRQLHIFADNDANHVGQGAADALRRRLERDGLAVKVHIPQTAQADWLDVLNQRSRLR